MSTKLKRQYTIGDNEVTAYYKHNQKEIEDEQVIIFKNTVYPLNIEDSLEVALVNFFDEHKTKISRKAKINLIEHMLEWYDIYIPIDFFMFLLKNNLMHLTDEPKMYKIEKEICEMLLDIFENIHKVETILDCYTAYEIDLFSTINKVKHDMFIAIVQAVIIDFAKKENKNI